MIIQSQRVFMNGRFLPAQIEIKEQKIHQIHPYNHLKCDVNYQDNIISPGFIDIHTHGAYGCDVNTGKVEDYQIWQSSLVKEGITAVFPSTSTTKKEILYQALANVRQAYENDYPGAKIMGIHLEGPFLEEKHRGAQPAEYLLKPSIIEFDKFNAASGNFIKYVTLAAEQDPDFELLRYLHSQGVVVSIGHSAATIEEAALAFANGAGGITHTFNGMSSLHHRAPGIVGAAMTLDVFAEIIADGQHVYPLVAKTLFKTNNKMIMITDSAALKGLPAGIYEPIPGMKVEVDEHGSCRFYQTDTLLGSSLKFNEGLRILVEEALVDISSALTSMSLNPALYLKIADRKGKILAGHDADLTVIGSDYQILATYVLGEAQPI